jgi:hypothetical protein
MPVSSIRSDPSSQTVYETGGFSSHSRLRGIPSISIEGMPVFPLGDRAKTPRLGWRWPVQNSSDPDVIDGWRDQYPHANFGVITGHGLVVIDVDSVVHIHLPGYDCWALRAFALLAALRRRCFSRCVSAR